MSIINDIIKEEFDRLTNLVQVYLSEISQFPRGYLSIKQIKGHEYVYLNRRDKDKVVSQYIGPVDSEKVKEIEILIQKRKKLEGLLRRTKQNLKEVKRVIRNKKQ